MSVFIIGVAPSAEGKARSAGMGRLDREFIGADGGEVSPCVQGCEAARAHTIVHNQNKAGKTGMNDRTSHVEDEEALLPIFPDVPCAASARGSRAATARAPSSPTLQSRKSRIKLRRPACKRAATARAPPSPMSVSLAMSARGKQRYDAVQESVELTRHRTSKIDIGSHGCAS